MTTDTKPLAPTDPEIVALMGDPRYSTIGAVREAISRWGSPSTQSSAAEFALQALVSAGHVSQELVDKAMALPGAPQPSPASQDAALESEYQRGYRQGYEQRDAEVRGALV